MKDGAGVRVNLAKEQALTLTRLKELLYLDISTGLLYWTVNGPGKRRVGKAAGTIDNHGYRVICVDYKSYFAHRLIWFYVHGEWPPHELDHKEMLRADNRVSELRLATHGQNKANSKRQRNNTTGYKGVSWFKPKRKFMVEVQKDKKRHFVGYFNTAEEGYLAYCKKAKELHGEFFRAE
jgi:HNH endonuclease